MSLEPMSTQAETQPEISSTPLPQQAEPPLMQSQKTAKRQNVFMMLMIVFSLLLFFIAAGIGYWAYTLNTQLTATQQQLSMLQAEHTQLKADYETLQGDKAKLNADLTQTKTDLNKANADLDKAKSDLAGAQAALTRSHDQNAELLTKLDAALRKAEALYIFANVKESTDFFKVDSAIQATHDNALIAQWKKLVSSPSAQGGTDLLLYLIGSVHDALK